MKNESAFHNNQTNASLSPHLLSLFFLSLYVYAYVFACMYKHTFIHIQNRGNLSTFRKTFNNKGQCNNIINGLISLVRFYLVLFPLLSSADTPEPPPPQVV